jgi:hypothetical protein
MLPRRAQNSLCCGRDRGRPILLKTRTISLRGSPISTPLTVGGDKEAFQNHDTSAHQTLHDSEQRTVAASLPLGAYVVAEAALCNVLLPAKDLDELVQAKSTIAYGQTRSSVLNVDRLMPAARTLEATVTTALVAAYGSSHAARGLNVLQGRLPGCATIGVRAQTAREQGSACYLKGEVVAAYGSAHGRAQVMLGDEQEALLSAAYMQCGTFCGSSMPCNYDPASAAGVILPSQTAASAAHLFLQRVLYRINRLNLFW